MKPLPPRFDPTRRCMKEAEWPPAHREAWRRALTSAALFEDGGEAAHWSPETRHKNRRGYGRWLNFCRIQGFLTAATDLAGLVTVERVRMYVAELRTTVSDYTVIARLAELHDVMSAMVPMGDWRWLTLAVSSLRNRGPRGRNKEPYLRPTRELFECGLAHLAEAESNALLSPYRSPGAIRTAL